MSIAAFIFSQTMSAKAGRKFADTKPEIVIGTATLGIPVAIEVSRYLGLDRYASWQVAKVHLQDALVEHVELIAAVGKQRLLLYRDAIPPPSGKRVLVVDMCCHRVEFVSVDKPCAKGRRQHRRNLARFSTEVHEWRPVLGTDADLVCGLGHIPQFRIHGGKATIIPSSVEAARPGAA